jgi:hypothetical protein
MRQTQVLNTALITLLAVAFLSSCGGKENKATNVDVTIEPEKPIVITGDIEVNGEELQSPWFRFQVHIKNGSEQAFTLVALQAEVTGVDESGQTSTATVSFAPNDSDGKWLGEDNPTCSYTGYGTYQPGDDLDLTLSGALTACPTGIAFYVGGNPKGPSGKSFRYRVKLKPLGYFIDSQGIASDRFEKFKNFYTQ